MFSTSFDWLEERNGWQMETLCIRNGTLLDGIYPNSTCTMSPSLPHRELILYLTGIIQVQFQLSPQNGNTGWL